VNTVDHVQLLIESAGVKQLVSLEYQWVGAATGPVMVFLHEGLGSRSMWKQFPHELCSQLKFRGLVYSRPGYGSSTAREVDEIWPIDFMQYQANEILPALLRALGVSEPIYLFGHSDGASIALLYAALNDAQNFVPSVRGCVALAPHIFVEPMTIQSIESARHAYKEGGLRKQLSRYHTDVDSAFYGWCNVWLNPAFLQWRIDRELTNIQCPLLLIQGAQDQYGSPEQLERIQQQVTHAKVELLSPCGHSAHKDQPDAVVEAVRNWLTSSGQC
jgi:pimeloyl-ACP methyl ester carboxylesterase